MKIDTIGRIVTWVLSAYFIVSGLMAALDINAKLERIGLSAVNDDGRIAFILIYTSLMVGIGSAMMLVYFSSKTWRFSLIIGGTIICSFIVCRVVGAIMVGHLSHTQIAFIVTELLELGVIVLIFKMKGSSYVVTNQL